MRLRWYQKEKMILPAINRFKEGSKSTLIVAPTGSGKTAAAAFWAKQAADKDRRVLVLVHKNTIQSQMMKTFHHFGIQRSAIKSGAPVTPDNVQIAMIATLDRRLDSIAPPDWIIGDEAHHWKESNMWGRAVNHYKKLNPELKMMGFTATPNGRTDGAGLHPFFEDMVQDLSMRDLVDDGWLVFPHTMRGEEIEVPKFHIKQKEYDKKEQTEFFSKRKVIGSVVENYHQYLDGLPTIVSCVSLDHAHYVAEQYTTAARQKGKSWKAVMVQGGKKYEKQLFDAIEGLGRGTVQIVTFVDVFGEGVDVPHCCGLQMLRKTKSLVLYLQFVGRILRPIWPNGFDQYNSTVDDRIDAIARSVKPFGRFQDFANNFEEHGHPIDKRVWTLEDTKLKTVKSETPPVVSVCPKCGGVWPGVAKKCYDCGHDFETTMCFKCGKQLPGRPAECMYCGADLAKHKTPEEVRGILREALPAGEWGEQRMNALVEQAMRLREMDPGDRQRAMISNLYKYGNSERTKALSEAVGYKKNWTRTMYRRITHRQ